MASEPQPEIEVLLATFNGEQFLREQIDSVLAQENVCLRILARDDGSTDGTVAILQEYAQRFPQRFRLLEDGIKTGNAKWNFLKLTAASEAPYICYCDQDDVWLADKVSRSLAVMAELEKEHDRALPLLVFTDLVVVNKDGATLFPSFWERDQIDPEVINRLRVLIGQNIVTGCSAMLNRRAAELSLRMPDECPMHDRWAGLIAAAMGRGGFVREKTVLYRQHGGNVIGAELEKTPFWAVLRWPRRPEKRIEQWQINQQVAAALLRVYEGELPAASKELLNVYIRAGQSPNRWLRVYLMLRHGLLRKGMRKKIATLWDAWNLDCPVSDVHS